MKVLNDIWQWKAVQELCFLIMFNVKKEISKENISMSELMTHPTNICTTGPLK